MYGWKRFRAKLSNFFRNERADRELAREVASHLALLEDDFRSRGMSAEQAALAARRAYGGVEQVKELHRDERSFVWLEQIWQDGRHAYRSLAKSPGFVAVAVASLAFGIGVNTAIFTLVNGILLKRIPAPDADRIVQISARMKSFEAAGFNYPVYRGLRRQDSVFSDVAAFSGRGGILETEAEQRNVDYELVTGSFFSFFGARPAVGRLLSEEDDRVEGGSPVCVLSYDAWQRHFRGDPRVVGRAIRINGAALQVVGVAGPGFVGGELQRRYELWAPTSEFRRLGGSARETGYIVWLSIMGKLKPGIPLQQALVRLESLSGAIENALPAQRTNKGEVYQFRDGSKGYDTWRKTLRDPLMLLLGAVTIVLLVACANLANLLLARANERHREFTIKLALGINQWRLLRQLLLETIALAMAGGVAGIALSFVLTRVMLGLFNAGNRANSLAVGLDPAVLLFTFGVCLLTALIAGLYPASQASRTDAAAGLNGASLLGGRHSLVRRGLIVVQVTLALILLFGASLFARSLGKLKTADLGYDIDRILTVQLAPRAARTKDATPVRGSVVLGEAIERVRRLPGVESAALAEPSVLSSGMMAAGAKTTGPSGEVKELDDVYFQYLSPGYLATMRLPLLRGRDFAASDRDGSQKVALVNQRMASLLWQGEDAVGKRFDSGFAKGLEVVGIVGDSKYQNVREKPRTIVYLLFDQGQTGGGALQIRGRGGLGEIERDVRQIVKSTAPDYQVSSASSMELMRDNLLKQDRLLSFLSTLFGILGVALALVGVYGLISYAVTSRTREIGIRMSIGAQRGDVLWLFLRESVMLVAIGGLIGMPVALWLAALLKKMLYEVSTSDPLSVSATLLLLAAGGLLASSIPAARATRTNPLQALRHD